MQRNVVILGLVSLFTDISSEMIYPLIPLYLSAVLGASPAILGVIEGIAESIACLLKIGSGRLSDQLGNRKALAISGYGLSAFSKILFILATTWNGIFLARVTDRLGKGIRTAPRDALITQSSDPSNLGKSFGLHRALDTLGAVIGIGLAYYLFLDSHQDYVAVFTMAIIPACMGVFLLFLVKEKNVSSTKKPSALLPAWKSLDKRLRFFLVISVLFNLGNSSNQFLLLKASNTGFSTADVILLYLGMNITYLLISYPAGSLSDRIGRRKLLVAGYFTYGLVYLGFAIFLNQAAIVLLFAIYGIYSGLTEGIEKAFLADVAPQEQRGTVFGLHALLVGITLLPASFLAGVLWEWQGASAPFIFGGILGIVTALLCLVGLKAPAAE